MRGFRVARSLDFCVMSLVSWLLVFDAWLPSVDIADRLLLQRLVLCLFSTGFLQIALYYWICLMLHETSFQIINMYSISDQNRILELL